MKRLLLLALLLAADAPGAVPAYKPALEGRVFDRAWRLVEQKYWDRMRTGDRWLAARDRFRGEAIAAPDRQHFYTILGEMLASLGDSHVYAIDPLQLRIGRARDDGRAAQGLGFDMLPDDNGVWRVATIRPGGPAARAGIELGWEVDSVDGRPVDIDYQPDAGAAVAVALTDDAGAKHILRLQAELEQPLPARREMLLHGDILVLALDGFNSGDDRWIGARIAAARPAGVILDLRGNGGGDAAVVARVAGRFFAEDRPLVERIGPHRSEQRTHGAGPDSWRGPLAVLIGRDSASGAEALAALIDEAGRGVTVGARTAGALTGAALYRLPDGGQLSVAEFDIRTPGGVRLEGVGLTPRMPVSATLSDRRAGRDPVLEKARALFAGR